MVESELEARFLRTWNIVTSSVTMPNPVAEYVFHNTRKWRFDFAWPSQRVAVEIEGGTYTNGRHVQPKGFEGDCEKYNAAALDQWLVLRFTSAQLSKSPVQCVEQTVQLIKTRTPC